MHPFACVAVLLKSRVVVAPLMIEHHDIGAGADSLQVPKRARLRRDRAAVHSGPDALRAAGFARYSAVQLPHFYPARVVPQDPVAVGAIVPVGPARKPRARCRFELARAIVAVADAL